jgi:hypothetical protein
MPGRGSGRAANFDTIDQPSRREARMDYAAAFVLTSLWALHFASHSIRVFRTLKDRSNAAAGAHVARPSLLMILRAAYQSLVVTVKVSTDRARPVMAQASSVGGNDKMTPTATPPKQKDSTASVLGITACGGDSNSGYCDNLCYRVINGYCYRCHSCSTTSYACDDTYPGGC